MSLHMADTRQVDEPRGSTMKFTYSSGSRPLDGYTIKRGIGRGGFGEVYYATSDAGKEVALKLIRRNLDVELRGVRHCLNLKHPNLVGIYDIKTDLMDDCWVVMEYVSGECLEDAIDRSAGGMQADEVLYWIHGIAAGVGYLHDRGIVHRDLKPGNIFSDEGMIKIGDYGLAKFISCSRRSGQTESVGTVHYMAPEIANGRYGREIDTYAMGIILYEMLSGHVPFEGESVGEVLMKHLIAQPEVERLEEPYRAIVATALTKDPDSRFKTAGELAALLPALPQGAGLARTYVPAGEPRLENTGGQGTPPFLIDRMQKVKQYANPLLAADQPEPIYRAIREGLKSVEEEWARANLPPLLRSVVIVIGILVLVVNAAWWVPLLFFALLGYGVYWVIRSIVLKTRARRQLRWAPPRDQAAAETQTLAAASLATPTPAAPPPIRHRRRRRWHHLDNELATPKGFRQKLTELSGSMLLSTFIVVTMSLMMIILSRDTMSVEQFVWMSSVGTFGAWAVMTPSKVWEGKTGDPWLRRFAMLLVGLAVGIVAYALYSQLFVELPHGRQFGSVGNFSTNFYDEGGTPQIMAFLAYFGFMFPVLRWWRQADPFRPARLSLLSTGCCVFWAWLLSQFWHFPQPWGLMLAAVISIAVQLASPWAPPQHGAIAADG